MSLGFGGEPLFDGVEVALHKGDRVCLVGRNGSGKSTLLKIAAGLIEADRGERFVQPGTHVAYLDQEPDAGAYETVADYVGSALATGDAPSQHRVEAALAEVGLDPAAALAALSGGEMRRAALARVLIDAPDILLLDEPTNHLDLPTIEWLERKLEASRAAIVVISHDRAFLNRLTRATLWLDRGQLRRLDKGFAAFEAWSDAVLTREAAERHKLNRLIAQEARWSVEGITARRKRNQGRLRRLRDLRAERARRIAPTGQVKLAAKSGPLSGKMVVEAEDIAKAFDGRTIVAGFSTRILRGDRIGIIGPNGAGKTTLLRMLTGDLKPDSGTVRLGTNLTPVYLDQRRASLNPALSVRETLCEGGSDQVLVQGQPRHVVSYLRDFLFAEAQARSPVGSLSGGERNRLMLARALAKPSNFLILDEPTNDLDMDTLDLLEEMLADYDGTLLLVSHDRDFLDRVVTATIAVAGDGTAVEYPGGYSDYLRLRPSPAPTKQVAAATAPPKPAAKPAPGKKRRKLSYRQQRDLDDLPKQIAAMEAEAARLEALLADPALYNRDRAAFDRATAELTAVHDKLGAAEERWLEIALLDEESETS